MNARIIQVRPSRDPRWQKKHGWEVFEAEGVCPVWCGENARQNALEYAQHRAGYGRCDIQVLDENGNVVETITNEDLRPIVLTPLAALNRSDYHWASTTKSSRA